ncbi:MAG: ATP-binding protein, partial [Paludibacteraceae bacterium]|nr:ATP-binding protein [Paludibacteraceae bacterium]
MTSKEQIREVIYDQRNLYVDLGIERKIDQSLVDCQEVLVLTGVRRCGKSVLMQQIRAKRSEKDYFISFDDDRLLHFTVDDFQLLYDVFVEDFGVQHTFYFDEIQLVDGWERFVDRLYKHGNKVIVTGSNAKMLSRELGTLLSGRHVSKEVYPFSLSEYMELLGVKVTRDSFYTTEGRAMLQNVQNDYLKDGGFPQYLRSKNVEYLKSLYNDIIYRDIIVRYRLMSDKPLKETVYYLISNATHLFTYNSVAKSVGLKSSETVKDYISYLEETYLVGLLPKYDVKVGEQIKSPKKIYFIDNALVGIIGFSFSGNEGSRLENAVYIELRRRGKELFYHNDGNECDFIVREGLRITEAYQVCVSMQEEKTRQRELEGIRSAMKAYSLSEGYIITREETEDVKVEEGVVHLVSF